MQPTPFLYIVQKEMIANLIWDDLGQKIGHNDFVLMKVINRIGEKKNAFQGKALLYIKLN